MISERLTYCLETNSLLAPVQAGFRENHSTNEEVVTVSQDIKEPFNRKKNLAEVFVDFQTAYGLV